MEIERCHRGSSRDSNFISPMKIWAVTFDPTPVKSDILDNVWQDPQLVTPCLKTR